MSAKHTPGPWQVEFSRNGLPYRIKAPQGDDKKPGAVGTNVTRWGSISLPSSDEGLANARLIAAAPCLFNAAIDGEGALRAAAAIMETQGHRKTAERFMHYAENLRKATDKATGEGEE